MPNFILDPYLALKSIIWQAYNVGPTLKFVHYDY